MTLHEDLEEPVQVEMIAICAINNLQGNVVYIYSMKAKGRLGNVWKMYDDGSKLVQSFLLH